MIVGADEKAVEDKFRWLEEHYRKHLPSAQVDRNISQLRSGPLVGTPEQLVEKLKEADGIGLAYAICYFADAAYDRSSIELFESQIIPAL